jgi:hypothetical protein
MYEENEKTGREWEWTAENIVFRLLKRNEPFTEEDFYSEAVSERMPPREIQRLCSQTFRDFERTTYIRKTGTTSGANYIFT